MSMLPLTPEQLEGVLAEAVERLRRELDPCEIYLFGSYVEGRAGADSDLDFLIVVPQRESARGAGVGSGSSLELGLRARRAMRDLRVPKDVLVYAAPEFEARAARPASFERTLKANARLLYRAA